ncbi:MAG TPA: tetratricopeptide repeat protein [Myxococcaceae bacterium]|nr:tetratricopeptide repeat protein [Myxococcaceae bacterium]
MPRSLRSSAALMAAAVALIAPAAARAQVTEASVAVDQVQGQLKAAEDNLRIVETQWTMHPEPSDEETLLRRFSDGEIQYLLGDTLGASVLFYDVVSDPKFQSSPRMPDALFYLADSLYQSGNLLGARVYLKQLLAMQSAHHAEALSRFLDVAGRTNEFEGIEGYINEVRGAGGLLPPEIAYVYGKWLFRRRDLPPPERMQRLEQTFSAIAENPEAPYRLQSTYFLGVAYVQAKTLDRAVAQFEKLNQLPARGEKEVKIKELANLSLGRLYYELGRYDDALDRYQEIPRESDNFPDSLYEIAWCQVKKGEFERAKNATDILLLVAPDSTLAPEAKILQGHLLLKLKKYGEADDTYDQVVNEYSPVYDEINALLTVEDPVSYFDKLLARNEKNLDVATLLPAEALKWATTQKEVSDAVHMINDLESGRRGIEEAKDIAGRVLKALEERGMESFPQLQEGYVRAEAVEAALTRSEQSLVRAETLVLQDALGDKEKAELEKLKAQIDELQKRFASAPTSQAEIQARRRKMQQRVDAADKEAFKSGYELQSLNAMLVAMGKWVDDTRNARKSTPEDEKAFRARIQSELEVVETLGKELASLRSDLAQERGSVDASVSGEDVLRKEYLAALDRQHRLLSPAEEKAGPEAKAVVQRAHLLRSSVGGLRDRVATAKGVLREQLTRRGRQLREKVLGEQQLLSQYQSNVSSVSGDARNLVGRIAFDSFKRVRQQFYDLVLKANVGNVDVAFTRKQDKTQQIQKLSAEKDRELRELDGEFKEVLKDVD